MGEITRQTMKGVMDNLSFQPLVGRRLTCSGRGLEHGMTTTAKVRVCGIPAATSSDAAMTGISPLGAALHPPIGLASEAKSGRGAASGNPGGLGGEPIRSAARLGRI